MTYKVQNSTLHLEVCLTSEIRVKIKIEIELDTENEKDQALMQQLIELIEEHTVEDKK